jgi:hypothetical protein
MFFVERFQGSTITGKNQELHLNSSKSYRNIFKGLKTEDLKQK